MKIQFITTVCTFVPVLVQSFQLTTTSNNHNNRLRTTTTTGSSISTTTKSSKSCTRRHSSSSGTENVVTRLENSSVLIAIPVPGDATRAAYDKVCTELSKTIQVPGFRKGSKLPPQLLEQSMSLQGGKNAIKVQAINELLSTLVERALREQSLDPIGQPRLSPSADVLAESYIPGEPLSLTVECDVWPEITWTGQYATDLSGTYQRKPVDATKLSKALMDLKERYATMEPISDNTHKLQMGDACTVNMIGYLATSTDTKGELLPNAASGDRVEVILGSGRYMEGLVEGLLDAKVGDTVEIRVTFPDKLRDKALAAKKAIFDVEVIEAFVRTVPDMTDEFAAKVKPGLTAESLIAELTKAIEEEDSKDFVPSRNKALGASLCTIMNVEVPDTLLTNQAREKFAMMMTDMRDGGVSDEEIQRQINPDNFLKYKEIVKDDIVRDFKISMATDEIARLEGIDVADYQVEEQMEVIRKDAAGAEDFDENMIRSKVKTTLVRQAVMDWLAERAQLTVEYLGAEPELDEALLEQIAAETLERERVMAAKVEGATVIVDVKSEEEQ